MAKDRNTYLKMQREVEKRRKAEEKRTRRRKKKDEEPTGVSEPVLAAPSATEE